LWSRHRYSSRLLLLLRLLWLLLLLLLLELLLLELVLPDSTDLEHARGDLMKVVILLLATQRMVEATRVGVRACVSWCVEQTALP